MKSIEELLRNLARPDVLEFGLVTNRLPSINVGGRFEPVDDEAPSTDRVKQMLVAMGGARFVAALSDKPVQWTARLDGVGVIAVAAIMRKDVVQARFTVARRETAAQRPSQGQAAAQPAPQAFPRTQQAAGVPQPAAPAPAPPQAPAPAPAREAPPSDEWEDDDDDNEPTVQTFSPQTPQNVPQPKPARRPEELRSGPPVRPSPSDTVTTTTAAPLPAAREPSVPPAAAIEVPSPASSGDVDVEITTNDAGGVSEPHDADVEPESRPQAIPNAAKAEPKPEPKPPAAQPKSDPKLVDPLLSAKTDPRLDLRVDSANDPRIEAKKPMTGAMPSIAHSAIPSTTPSAVAPAEKEPPRIDGGAAFDSFLAMATAAQATDLVLASGRPVLLRVASELVPRTQAVTAEHLERIVKEVVPPRLRETLDGEGACDFAIDHPAHGRFRVNVSKQRGGTTLAIRVLGREVPSVRGLSLPDTVAGAAGFGQGLVLVTGPAGHGKSTTLAALVDAINANADAPRHVYTIEDPIEHVHPKRRGIITQREIGTHVRSWAHGIEDALSSDVDVVVIGDIRDEGAARATIAACEAGKLVLATMSCTTVARAIDRLLERFPPNEQPRTRSILAPAIRLVVGQRLVPSADGARVHVAIESLPGTSALFTLVRDGRTHHIPALHQRARSPGFVRLDDALAELVRAQKVTLDVAKQFAESPADLAAKKG